MRTALRLGLGLGALALVGCAHRSAVPQSHVEAMAAQQYDTIGHTHMPYTGIPKYLAEARPLRPTREPVAGAPNPCQTRSTECDDRLRAVLASLEGQILALQTPPTELQLQALRLAVLQLTPLLTPYPDMMSERDELGDLVEELPTVPPARQPELKQRMSQVTDLIRVQLAAAQ
jgi:hypothetical protein